MATITQEEIQIIIKEVHREDPIGIKIAVEKMIDDRTSILREALERIASWNNSDGTPWRTSSDAPTVARDALLRAGKGEVRSCPVCGAKKLGVQPYSGQAVYDCWCRPPAPKGEVSE